MEHGPLQIAVVGGSQSTPQAWANAEEVGKELARRGIVVICGGLTGVMEAVCKGAREAGGTTVGILPGSDSSDANPYVEIAVCTGMGYARNALVVKSGAAVIAIDGAFGTLSEIALALGEGIPVVGLDTWSFTVDSQEDSSVLRASTPREAVEKAIIAAKARQRLSGTPKAK